MYVLSHHNLIHCLLKCYQRPSIRLIFNVRGTSWTCSMVAYYCTSRSPICRSYTNSPEHTLFSFLHLHHRVSQPVVHLQVIISTHAFGIGSSVIRTGTSLSSISLQPDSSGLGRICFGQCACRHTKA